MRSKKILFEGLSILFVGSLCFLSYVVAEQDEKKENRQSKESPPKIEIKEYNGNFIKDERYIETHKRIKEQIPKACKQINERIGLSGKNCEVDVIFSDQKTKSFWAQTKRDGGRITITVFLDAFGKFIQDEASTIELIFTHELTHAFMRGAMEQSGYSSLPRWFREGTAMYAAEQGEPHIRLAYKESKGNLQKLLPGLEAKYNADSYVNYFLAIEYINSKYGAYKVKKLVIDVVKGMNCVKAVEELTKLDFDKFDKEVHDFGIEYMKKKGLIKTK